MKHLKKMQSEFELCTRQLTEYHNEGFTCEADKQLAVGWHHVQLK